VIVATATTCTVFDIRRLGGVLSLLQHEHATLCRGWNAKTHRHQIKINRKNSRLFSFDALARTLHLSICASYQRNSAVNPDGPPPVATSDGLCLISS
jgi:hypothetical protein